MGIIYQIKNKINNKIYIGQSIKETIEERYRNFKKIDKKSNRPIDRAIIKYGWDNFEFSYLEKNVPENSLNEKEQFYIKLYKSTIDDGNYNLTSGGSKRKQYTKNLLKRMSIKATKINHWYHWDHGEFKCSRNELKIKFPNLNILNLSQLSSGKKLYYNGWCLAKNKNLDMTNLGVYNWYHPEYGRYKCKIYELINKFKHLNLSDSALGKLYKPNKEFFYRYKDWICYNNELDLEKYINAKKKYPILKNPSIEKNKTVYNWYNILTHIKESISIYELIIKYNLSKNIAVSKLNEIISKKRYQYKKWTLEENIIKDSYIQYLWYNPKYGEEWASPKELYIKYNLPVVQPLINISRNKKGFKSYYGWKIKNKDDQVP